MGHTRVIVSLGFCPQIPCQTERRRSLLKTGHVAFNLTKSTIRFLNHNDINHFFFFFFFLNTCDHNNSPKFLILFIFFSKDNIITLRSPKLPDKIFCGQHVAQQPKNGSILSITGYWMPFNSYEGLRLKNNNNIKRIK